MSVKIERTYKEVGIIKKKSDDLTHLIDSYKDSVDKLSKLVVGSAVGGYSWNQQLIAPLVSGEIVYVHPDQAGVSESYVRVIHSEHRAVSIFLRTHFETES